MLLKKLLRYSSFILMIGASLILGFLSFSGMYILIPMVSLAIAAFFLSIVFEGEIYYQNINSAIKSLFNPKYAEGVLGEQCLQEATLDIQNDIELIDTIEELQKAIDNLETPEADPKKLEKKYKKLKEVIQRQKDGSIHPEIQDVLAKANFLTDEKLTEILNTDEKSTDSLSATKASLRTELYQLSKNIHTHINIPEFFIHYAQIANIEHPLNQQNLTNQGIAQREDLDINLKLLEKTFAEQLFYKKLRKKAQASDKNQLQPKARATQVDLPLISAYKKELRLYLQKHYAKKYQEKLKSRLKYASGAKILSTICGFFMTIGTSYLLVEAFAVVPLLSAIPFGILPAVIVPMSIIAGTAYGILTYNSIMEMINSEIVVKRIAKIKEDIKSGKNPIYTAGKVLFFTALLGLALTLTICTGGTWYTVVKHTKPIFAWLRHLPAAASGIIATFLALAALAFNIGNSAQTAEEIEEYIESEVPEDHELNIDLLELEPGQDIERAVKYTKRMAIIKQGKKYYIHCQNPDSKEWRRAELPKNAILTRLILYFYKFNNRTLYFSAANLLLYIAAKWQTGHIFKPSTENKYQRRNPFRILLLFTYVPLRIAFFLGHLVSISATADRVPGIPEVISMIVGFVAELFEDLHYFMSLKNKKPKDTATVVEERFKNEEESNDLPTRLLRDWLFYPIFCGAAYYHSRYSDKVDAFNEKTGQVEKVPSISYNAAFELMHGKDPISGPNFASSDEVDLANNLSAIVTAKTRALKKARKIEDKHDIPETADNPEKELLEFLTTERVIARDSTDNKIDFRLFNRPRCSNSSLQQQELANTVLRA